jgi:hypothetical protein
LDAGAGDGWFAQQLKAMVFPQVELTCWDVGYTENVEQRLARSGAPCAFVREQPERRYDLVFLLDVLEHVEDAHDFLCGLVEKNLAADSRLVVSVPAWDFLYSEHDRALGHYRRYRPSELKHALERANLEILQKGSLFFSLFVVRALQTVLQKGRAESEVSAQAQPVRELRWDHGLLVTACVRFLLQVDALLCRLASRIGVALPGLSTWALCRVKSE